VLVVGQCIFLIELFSLLVQLALHFIHFHPLNHLKLILSLLYRSFFQEFMHFNWFQKTLLVEVQVGWVAEDRLSSKLDLISAIQN
jgi:hypothetical protein